MRHHELPAERLVRLRVRRIKLHVTFHRSRDVSIGPGNNTSNAETRRHISVRSRHGCVQTRRRRGLPSHRHRAYA